MKKLKEFLSNFKGVKNSKKKGFTLIELIAVIAILAILAAVLIPNIVGYINKAKQTKVISDAGNIVTAIDTYEAENAENTSAYVYADSAASTTLNEDSVTLATLATDDKTSQLIIGGTAPIKALPVSFGGAAGDGLTVTQIRQIAKKQLIVTLNGSGVITGATVAPGVTDPDVKAVTLK